MSFPRIPGASLRGITGRSNMIAEMLDQSPGHYRVREARKMEEKVKGPLFRGREGSRGAAR